MRGRRGLRVFGAALLGAVLVLAAACSSSSSSGAAWCCTEIGGICICEQGQGNCPSQVSCTATYSCCGVTHDSSGTGCSCASDGFLQSISETCDEWFTSGGGSGRQPVASCPPH